MIYLKSIAAGIGAAFVAVVIWQVAQLLYPVFLLFIPSRAGSGGIGAVTSGLASMLAVALVGFLAGFAWQYRRSSTAASIPGRA